MKGAALAATWVTPAQAEALSASVFEAARPTELAPSVTAHAVPSVHPALSPFAAPARARSPSATRKCCAAEVAGAWLQHSAYVPGACASGVPRSYLASQFESRRPPCTQY